MTVSSRPAPSKQPYLTPQTNKQWSFLGLCANGSDAKTSCCSPLFLCNSLFSGLALYLSTASTLSKHPDGVVEMR